MISSLVLVRITSGNHVVGSNVYFRNLSVEALFVMQ